MDQTPSEIDAVAWVRAVRDAMYEETEGMGAEEFAAYVARKAAAVRAQDASRLPSAPAAERGLAADETHQLPSVATTQRGAFRS